MKNSQLLETFEALQFISTIETPLPATINYARAVNMKKLGTYFDEFTNAKDELIRKYGTTEDGSRYTFDGENKDKYYAELSDLLNVDVDVTLQKISADALMTLALTPKQFDALMLIADDKEVE